MMAQQAMTNQTCLGAQELATALTSVEALFILLDATLGNLQAHSMQDGD